MLYEELRLNHEDIERLQQAIADRVLDNPQHIRSRLVRDHEIANFLSRIESQSARALSTYRNEQAALTKETQFISTGDPFQSFDEELNKIRDFHRRNPNEPVENLERAYKRTSDGGVTATFSGDIDNMFTGEEGFGRFFDLTILHEDYLNLPGVRGVRKTTYLQFLDSFDVFTPPRCIISRKDKLTDQYFVYVGALRDYLESFMRRTRPLEDVDKLFGAFHEEFQKSWDEGTVSGWEVESSSGTENVPTTEGSGTGVWCADCQKEFNPNVYKSHLSGKKHIKNAEARQKRSEAGDAPNLTAQPAQSIGRLKERAVAEREFRIRKLAAAMQTSREDTRVNVERKAGMTDKERQQEIEALYADDTELAGKGKAGQDEDEEEGGEKLYNPLKLPLAWDGKPIPFWLYKLHGLGVEFPCEICGNYVYMGRRAFDRHFSEQRHMYGLSCLGINKSTGLFREITKIAEAQKLHEKIESDRARDLERKGGVDGKDIVEMEDRQGNVMPKKVYDDLLKLGLL